MRCFLRIPSVSRALGRATVHGPALCIAILAAQLAACAPQATLLNSERIERRFGSYGVEILSQNDVERRSNLYSIGRDETRTGERICRTYALVRYIGGDDRRIAAAQQRIVAGASIGSTLRTAGWTIQKKTLHSGRIRISETGGEIARLMRIPEAFDAAVHVYRMTLERGTERIDYALFIEIHHPEYLDAAALGAIVEPVSHGPSAEVARLIDRALAGSR